jgi:hypothetical protein
MKMICCFKQRPMDGRSPIHLACIVGLAGIAWGVDAKKAEGDRLLVAGLCCLLSGLTTACFDWRSSRDDRHDAHLPAALHYNGRLYR